jgi:hypothetical protein
MPDALDGFDLASLDGMSPDQIAAALNAISVQPGGAAFRAPSPEVMSRIAPDLEALLPREITEPPLRINSVRASKWGSSLLNRAIKRLAVDPHDAVVVIAMGGRGPSTLTIMLYSMPGVSADRLLA